MEEIFTNPLADSYNVPDNAFIKILFDKSKLVLFVVKRFLLPEISTIPLSDMIDILPLAVFIIELPDKSM